MVEFGVPGFFGKLPSRGDFVSRRLPRDFLNVWDRWLQEGLASSQASLGPQWLDVYLTSPVWCFVLSAGTCGESAYTGVMIPSVDKVGRYFPLAVAMPFAGIAAALSVRRELESWYARTQELLLETLDEPPLDLDAFDERLAKLRPAAAPLALDWDLPDRDGHDDVPDWQFFAPHGLNFDALNAALLSAIVVRDRGPHSIWWTAGSDRVGAAALLASGLPPSHAFAALLDGSFRAPEWACGVLRATASFRLPISAQSAAVSDPGKVRNVNEDAFACRDSVGVWLVADGLGGHQAGDVASRMVASVVEHVPSAAALDVRVAAVVRNIQVVNSCLQVLADRDARITMTGSTVCALLVADDEAACVWAGDSRLYRLRDRQLQQLTRDHADGDAESGTLTGEVSSRTITRAVGGPDALELDVVRSDVLPGDRYLLCTDGLYTMVSDDELGRVLEAHTAAAGACAELKRLALDSAASDNLTAVVVHIDNVQIDNHEASVSVSERIG